eukprot:m.117009 g.117009  ORF g.117009 m.117009 type:complete len:152 (-) comp16085_c0_seq2:103-558(-)
MRPSAPPSDIRARVGPSAPSQEDLAHYASQLRKKDAKDFRQYNEMVLEELVPKETGREARIDKRRAQNESRRDRATSPEIRDKDLLGSSDFHEMMARRRQQKAAKQEEKRSAAETKIAAYQEKERDKIAALLSLAKASKSQDALWQSGGHQ